MIERAGSGDQINCFASRARAGLLSKMSVGSVKRGFPNARNDTQADLL